MTVRIVTFGLGGFDETQPDNNVISVEELPEVVVPVDEARQSAMTKLAGWGLSEEEILAIVG
jgi:hypothetical protein